MKIKRIIKNINTIIIALTIFLSSASICYASVDINGLEGVLNGLITQQQVNQSNNPKFSDRANTNEYIDPITGSLSINQTDITLPGKDGLDLSISRVYNSSMANYSTKKVEVTSSSSQSIVNTPMGWIVKVITCDSYGNWSTFYEGPYADPVDAWTIYYIYLSSSNSDYVYFPGEPYYDNIEVSYSTYTITTTNYPEKNNYLRKRYDLGTGWALGFPSVQIEQEDNDKYIYFHDGTGAAYRVVFTPETYDSNLENYQGKDVQFLEDTGTYTNEDNITSKYKFITSDKREIFFGEDGRLLGIRDRFGNEIKFRHTERMIHGEAFPYISQITDSVGRIIGFIYENTINNSSFDGEKITITINDPANTKSTQLVYKKERITVNLYDENDELIETYYEPRLYEITYPDGSKTYIHRHTDKSQRFMYQTKDLVNSAKTNVVLIGDITYRYTKTIYDYDKVVRNLGPNGAVDAYRINSRYDQERRYDKTSDTWYWTGDINHIDYTYYHDCTGYPSYDSDEAMPESYVFWSQSEDSNGIKVKNIFNGKKKNIRVENYASNGEKKVIENQKFDETFTFKPIKTEISNFDSNGSNVSRLYVGKKYNEWGGVEEITQPLTLTQYSDDSIKLKYTTKYQYNDPIYTNFITSKQWYRDLNTLLTEDYTYDSLGRIKTETNAKGEVTNYNYSTTSEGDIVEATKALEDGKTAKTINVYGPETNKAYITKAKQYYTNDQGILEETITEKTYDMLLGFVKTEKNNNDEITEYEYDNVGRVLSVRLPNFTNIDNNTYEVRQEYTYYDNQYYSNYNDVENEGLKGPKVFSTIHYTDITDINNPIDWYEKSQFSVYDGYGNLRQEELYNYQWLVKSSYIYDDLTRLIKSTDGENNSYTYAYDDWGRINESIDPFGNLFRKDYSISEQKVSSYLVEEANVANYRLDPTNNSYKENMLEGYMDQWNRVIERRAYPNWPSTTEYINELYSYDIVGNQLSYIDPKENLNEDGYTKTYSYDELNRLVQVKDALNQLTEIDYTILGEIEGINLKENSTSQPEELYTKEYDELGKLVTKVDPLNNSDEYSYNGLGLNVQATDRNGSLFTNTYDEHNNLKSSLISNTGSGESIEYRSNYNNPYGPGETYMYTDGVFSGWTDYLYNQAGEILEKNDLGYPNQYKSKLSNSYDNAGKFTSINIGTSSIDQFYTNYNYDKTRINRVQTNGQETDDISAQSNAYYEYYPNGQLKKITYPKLNDASYLTTEYIYDNLNRLSTITNKKGSTIISEYSYGYDDNGNITSYTDSNGTITYDYDKLNRLTVIDDTNRLVIYNYDLQGNRQTIVDTSMSIDLDSVSYSYDVMNRLKQVTKGSTTTNFEYRTDGLRYEKETPQETIQYHYNLNGKVIAEGDGTGDITANYVWGPDRALVKKEVSGNEYYYLYNGHGDVVQIVDRNGNVVNNYTYDEWGNIKSQTEGISNPFKYAGEIFDEETGLYYLRARYYDPTMGRFISEDSYEGQITNPLSLNLYSYTYNNPLGYTDPSGHDGISVLKGDDNYFSWLLKRIFGNTDKSYEDYCEEYYSQADGLREWSEWEKKSEQFLEIIVFLYDYKQININTSYINNSKRFYRVMSKAELDAVKNTGKLRGGREGTTYFTDSYYKSSNKAKKRLALPESPQYILEFEIKNSPKIYGGTKVTPNYGEVGGGREYLSDDIINVKIINYQKLLP